MATTTNNSVIASDYVFPAHFLKEPTKIETTNKNVDTGIVLVSCGSFNPITVLHLRIFESAKDYIQLEKGIPVVGGFISPVHADYGQRKSGLVAPEHRLAMCKQAVSDSDWIAIDDWEIKQKEYSRTRVVLNHFVESINTHMKNPEGVRIILLCGADLLESFVKPGVWRPEDVAYILSNHGVACVEREGVNLPQLIFEHDVLYKNRQNIFLIPNLITNDVSSTKVRKLLQRSYSVKYYVHDKVIKYIQHNKLYLPI